MENIDLSNPSENSTLPTQAGPPQAGIPFFEKLKGNWPLLISIGIVSVAFLSFVFYAVYSYNRRGQEVQPPPTTVVTPLLTPALTVSPTSIETPTIHPSTTESLIPTSTTEDLPTETISYSPKTDWLTYTDNIAKFKIQYPPKHKLGDEITEGSNIYFLNCGGKDPKTGDELCLSGFSIDVYNDYTQGSRRIWLNSKIPFYKTLLSKFHY